MCSSCVPPCLMGGLARRCAISPTTCLNYLPKPPLAVLLGGRGSGPSRAKLLRVQGFGFFSSVDSAHIPFCCSARKTVNSTQNRSTDSCCFSLGKGYLQPSSSHAEPSLGPLDGERPPMQSGGDKKERHMSREKRERDLRHPGSTKTRRLKIQAVQAE